MRLSFHAHKPWIFLSTPSIKYLSIVKDIRQPSTLSINYPSIVKNIRQSTLSIKYPSIVKDIRQSTLWIKYPFIVKDIRQKEPYIFSGSGQSRLSILQYLTKLGTDMRPGLSLHTCLNLTLFFTLAKTVFFRIELISYFTLIQITSYGSFCGNTEAFQHPAVYLWKYGGVPSSRYDLRHSLAIMHINHILVHVLSFLKIKWRQTETNDVPNKNGIYIWDRYFSQIVANHIKVSLSS